MSKHGWKQFERDAATLFGTTRFKANTGDRLDFESDEVVGQCKNVKRMSLEKITQLAEEMDTLALAAGPDGQTKAGVVTVKVSRGSGKKSPLLVVMTAKSFAHWNKGC